MRIGPGALAAASRSAFTSAVLCMAMTVAGVAPVLAYQQEIQRASTGLGEAMAKTGKRTVAVVDFTDLQVNATELGRFLAEQLSLALGTSGGSFEVIDRNHLRALLQEHRLSTTGLIDAQTAQKLGKVAGAERPITGSITPFSESVNLSIKLIDTNTAKILGGMSVDIPRTSTINELLGKGVDTPLVTDRTARTTSQPAQATAGSAPKSAAAVSDVVHRVTVAINECKKTGHDVSCQGTLRNESDAPLHFTFMDYGEVDIVDDLGNQSQGRAAFGSSPGSSRDGRWVPLTSTPSVELEPDLPVKFWIHDVEVDDGAKNVTARLIVTVGPPGQGRVRVGGFSGTGGSGGRKVVVLRNIGLR